MELWDIYDKDRQLTGRTMVRGTPYAPDAYHLVIHVCIFNKKGQMLIQRRQPFKEGHSGMWDVTVGGSSVAGDDTRTAAARELLEEVGISYDFSALQPHLTVNFDHGFDDIYLIEHEVDISTLHLQYEEVAEVKWADLEEILTMIEDGRFIPYHKNLIRLLFDMRHGLGAHQKKERRQTP